MTERKGPIAFRMNQEDYTKFANYVDSTDLSKSKIAERAVQEYISEQVTEPTERVTDFVVTGVILTFTALLAAAGRLDLTALWIVLISVGTAIDFQLGDFLP